MQPGSEMVASMEASDLWPLTPSQTPSAAASSSVPPCQLRCHLPTELASTWRLVYPFCLERPVPGYQHGSLLPFQTSALWEEAPHTPWAQPCSPCSMAASTCDLLRTRSLLSPLERKLQGGRALALFLGGFRVSRTEPGTECLLSAGWISLPKFSCWHWRKGPYVVVSCWAGDLGSLTAFLVQDFSQSSFLFAAIPAPTH